MAQEQTTVDETKEKASGTTISVGTLHVGCVLDGKLLSIVEHENPLSIEDIGSVKIGRKRYGVTKADVTGEYKGDLIVTWTLAEEESSDMMA